VPANVGNANADRDGNVYMIWKSTGTLYNTFTDCVVTLSNAVTTGNAAAEKAKLLALDSAITVMKYFEGKYKCSSICKPALFYYSRPLSDGMPD